MEADTYESLRFVGLFTQLCRADLPTLLYVLPPRYPYPKVLNRYGVSMPDLLSSTESPLLRVYTFLVFVSLTACLGESS